MKTNKLYISFALSLILIIMVMGFVSADLGTFKQNSCVQIRTLGNCSLTLSEVTSPINTYIINTAMTNLGGQTYNYSFCNTSTLGTYTYSWRGSCLNCGSDDCGNSFEISPSGNESNSSINTFYVLIIILIYSISFVGFFGKNEWVTILGGMGMMALGLYTINSGLVVYQDFITKVFSWTTIGIGAFFTLVSGISLIQETYN